MLASRPLKLRWQLSAAAGKKESVSSSFFMEVKNREVEEDLPTMATIFWAEGVWMGNMEESSRRRGGSRSLKHRHRYT